MNLYLVRHGIAEDRIKLGLKFTSDSLRPLTIHGKKKFNKVFMKIKKLIGAIDLIVSSPLLRAQQTAKIVSIAYPQVKFMTANCLKPASSPSDFCRWAVAHIKDENAQIVIVGHEPQLSILACWLLFGRKQSQIKIKKGGCLAIEIVGRIGPASGILIWAVTPKTLGVN
jgi:phosphohistidine phosphatase